MKNVYFEDYAGVSPQWLAVRVRLQGGLIPATIRICNWMWVAKYGMPNIAEDEKFPIIDTKRLAGLIRLIRTLPTS